MLFFQISPYLIEADIPHRIRPNVRIRDTVVSCECGCNKAFTRGMMVSKPTPEPTHPTEFINRTHGIRYYGSHRELRLAGFR